MKLFLDTANLEEIREAAALGIIDGLTTNPSLLAKERVNGMDAIRHHFSNVCEWVDGDISVEVVATEREAMVEEARQLASIDPRIVIKVPANREGIQVIHQLSNEGFKTNCTLVFSALQALAAMKAGATYVSPFVGRLEDQGVDKFLISQQEDEGLLVESDISRHIFLTPRV